MGCLRLTSMEEETTLLKVVYRAENRRVRKEQGAKIIPLHVGVGALGYGIGKGVGALGNAIQKGARARELAGVFACEGCPKGAITHTRFPFSGAKIGQAIVKAAESADKIAYSLPETLGAIGQSIKGFVQNYGEYGYGAESIPNNDPGTQSRTKINGGDPTDLAVIPGNAIDGWSKSNFFALPDIIERLGIGSPSTYDTVGRRIYRVSPDGSYHPVGIIKNK